MSETCIDCSPRDALEEGCCSTNVGFGIKYLLVRRTGERIPVCRRYVRLDDGTWGCSDYWNRPPECVSFECEKILNERCRE